MIRLFGDNGGEEVLQVNWVIEVGFEQQNQDENLSNLHCVHL